MYKVMLADDDYPVLELLSEEIDWEGMGFRLMGAHGNGASAWEQAQEEMPDLLITDIGMPEMDGLELTARLKELKPGLRTVILSCHDEFQYARQAVRLSVQEYLLKDTLDPEDLAALLRRFKASMDEERRAGWERSRLKALENETRDLRKERTIRNFVDQPLLSPEKWRQEAEEIGLRVGELSVLPAVGFIDRYAQVRERFSSGRTLRFAVNNVADEMLAGLELQGQHVGYDERTSLFLFAYKPSLKTNVYDQVREALRGVQSALSGALKIRMSFVIGTGCPDVPGLRRQLRELVGGTAQRFYLKDGEIAMKAPPEPAAGDLFAFYDRASTELREAIAGGDASVAEAAADYWIAQIGRERYGPETAKDWTLKLVLDLKLKLHSLAFGGLGHSADTLHKEIGDLDSLLELRDWLVGHLRAAAGSAGKAGSAAGAKRADVKEACKYVSRNLGRRIALEEVADHLHLNASYFSRLFKKELGVTFIEYVTRMKMERAKELLDQTSHTVGEICEMLGYDNQSYFIKTFKAHAGSTPAEYRG